MNNWFTFFLAALATYRLSLMFSKERGPFRVFERLRSTSKKEAKEWLSCIFCFSVSAAAVITLYLWYFEAMEWESAPMYCLALSAVAVILNQTFTKGR